MTETRKTGWQRFGGGLALSLLLHGLAVAVFLLSFDSPEDFSQEEQAIDVTLVTPPEPEEPEPQPEPEPEPEPEAETPEEAAEPEAAPPPAPEPENQAEPVPQPPEPELAPVAEPPAPPNQESESEQPLPPGVPVPTARTLLRLADRDQLPRPSEGTDEAEQAESSAAAEPEAPSDKANDSRELPDVTLPEAPAAEQMTALNDQDKASAGSHHAGNSKASIIAEKPIVASDEEALKPREVKRLLSHSYPEGEIATVSMAGMTREERVMDLCGAELSLQLRSGSPRYDVEYLPSFKAGSGNLVNYPRTAFRQRDGVWFDLAVVCEVDDKATRVVRFAYSVGERVPKSEWQARGLFGT